MCRRAWGVLLLFFAAPSGTFACTCANATPGSCQGLNVADAIFVGTVTFGETLPQPPGAAPGTPITAHYRIRVDEDFKAAAGSVMDIYAGGNDGDCGFIFKQGERYLVMAYSSDDGRLFATRCSGTRRVKDAAALLPQLEAMKRGEKVASIFGILRRTDPPYEALSDNPDYVPLNNVDLKLRSNLNRLETSTDDHGIYTLYNIPAGEYQVSADLPKFLELADPGIKGPPPPIWLETGACYEFNIDAMPVGQIRGSVLGPQGKPLHPASVELYRQGRFREDRPGWWAFQGSDGFFEFDHVPPGEYILVFNRRNRRDPNAPFPRAFYPDAGDVDQAKAIEVDEGGSVVTADIRLQQGFASHRVRVAIKSPRNELPHGVYVVAKADKGDNPIAYRMPDGTYEITLLQGVSYRISAWGYLDSPRPPRRTKKVGTEAPGPAPGQLNEPQSTATGSGTNSQSGATNGCGPGGRIDTSAVEVDGSDQNLKEVTLLFPKAACEAE